MADSASSQQQLQRAASAQFMRPLLHLLSAQEARHRYLTQCVPLHKAAIKGDWKEARKISEQDWTLLHAAITKGWATVLHIAVGANHVHFVKELVKLMQHDDLELQDDKGYTAFCFAAAVGNVAIAEIMQKKNESLPTIRGGEGVTPLHLAVLQGRSKMAWYLFPKSKEILKEVDWQILFLICRNSGLHDLALEIQNQKYTRCGRPPQYLQDYLASLSSSTTPSSTQHPITEEMAMADSTSSQQQLQRAASAQFRRPLLHLLSTHSQVRPGTSFD